MTPATASKASLRSCATFSDCIIDDAALGESLLLARLRRELGEFLDRMAQEIGLLARLLDAGAVIVQGRARASRT